MKTEPDNANEEATNIREILKRAYESDKKQTTPIINSEEKQ